MKRIVFNFLFVAALAFVGSYALTSCGSKSQEDAHEEAEHAEGEASEMHEHDGEAGDHDSEKLDGEEHEGDDHSEVMTYACPMHPEEKGKEGDTCSKCKMALVKINTEEKK